MNEEGKKETLHSAFAQAKLLDTALQRTASGEYVQPPSVKAEPEQESAPASSTVSEGELLEEKAASERASDGEVKNAAANRTKYWAAVGAVAALVVIGICAGVWAHHLPLTRFIITGNRLAKVEQLEASLSKWLGKELSRVNLSEIEEALQANVLIKKAVATKEFPDAVRVQLTERTFVALAVVSGHLKLVGDDGLMADVEPRFLGAQRLPMLVGFEKVRRASSQAWALDTAEVQSALELLIALRSRALCRAMLSEVKVEPHQLVAVAADANTRFIFGTDGDYDRKLDYLETFWKEVIAKKGLRQFEYVDLRYRQRVFAKLTENESLTLKRQ